MKNLIFTVGKSTETNKMMTQQLKETYELQFQVLRTKIKTICWVLGVIGSVLAIAVTIALTVFAR